MSRLHGTWQAEGHGVRIPGLAVAAVALVLLAGSGAVAAIEAAATMILAVVLAVAALTVAALVAALVLLHRYNRREAGKFELRAEVLRESRPAPRVTGPAPQLVVNHFHGGTHLHLAPGSAAGPNRAIPLRDAITITTDEGD